MTPEREDEDRGRKTHPPFDATDDSTDDDPRAQAEEYLLAELRDLGPSAFQQLVADVWERLGWETEMTGEPAEWGSDVVATAQNDEKQIIQVKRYGPSTTIGPAEVQQYASLRFQEDGERVTIVTTGEFLDEAEETAPDLNVTLIDGKELFTILDELDSWDVIRDHVDGLEALQDLDSETENTTGEDGVLDRALSWFN